VRLHTADQSKEAAAEVAVTVNGRSFNSGCPKVSAFRRPIRPT